MTLPQGSTNRCWWGTAILSFLSVRFLTVRWHNSPWLCQLLVAWAL